MGLMGLNELATEIREINQANGWPGVQNQDTTRLGDELEGVLMFWGDAVEGLRSTSAESIPRMVDRLRDASGCFIGATARAAIFRESPKPDSLQTHIILIATEVAELAMASAETDVEMLPELADIIIRCLNVAADMGWDIEAAVMDKLKSNKGRGYRHGGKLF